MLRMIMLEINLKMFESIKYVKREIVCFKIDDNFEVFKFGSSGTEVDCYILRD